MAVVALSWKPRSRGYLATIDWLLQQWGEFIELEHSLDAKECWSWCYRLQWSSRTNTQWILQQVGLAWY